MVRSDVSRASYAKPFVQHSALLSKQAHVSSTERGGPHATISTCTNAFTADYVRRPARSMLSSKVLISSSQPKHGRNSTTTRSACLQMATDGRKRSPGVWNLTRRIGEVTRAEQLNAR